MINTDKETRIVVIVPDGLKQRLKMQALREGVSMKMLILKIADEYLREREEVTNELDRRA